MDLEKSTIIRVTTTEDFIIPDYESNVDGVMEEWFSEKYINGSHAYRDGSRIGGSKKKISVEKVSIDTWKSEVEAAKNPPTSRQESGGDYYTQINSDDEEGDRWG